MLTINPIDHSDLFRHAADVLEPDDSRIQLARSRYEDLQNTVVEFANDASLDLAMFPQGSYRIGTTIQDPTTLEFDIDTVIAPELPKDRLSPEQLVTLVGELLTRYVEGLSCERSDIGAPILEPGKRAWTLKWDRFHIDVLPVVPDLESKLSVRYPPAHWLSDKDLFRWQATHPQGFAQYFDAVNHDRRFMMAERAGVDIEELPRHGPHRTELQRVIQLFKWHRSLWRPDLATARPPSIVITALATMAYDQTRPDGSLLTVMRVVATEMPHLVDFTSNPPDISNPTCDEENYADRYRDQPGRVRALQNWLDDLRSDLRKISGVEGPALNEILYRCFGRPLTELAWESLGGEVKRAAGNRGLVTSSAGSLGFAGAQGPGPSIRANPKKDFYGV